MLKKYYQIFLLNKRLILLLAAGTFCWSLTMVKSGLQYSFGFGFWGANGHDGIWHIAVAESLLKGSWGIPVFSGKLLENYHIGFDLLLAILSKITFIKIPTLYFQILPPVFSFLIGFSVYRFILYWKKSKLQAFWATFFVYFAGSWGWVVTFLRGEKLGGESMFWSQQSLSTLINPPFALSLIIIFIALSFLKRGINKNNKLHLFLSTFLFGVLIQIKVYAGLLCLAALALAGFYELLKRRGISIIKVFAGALFISILLFSTSGNSQSLIVFKPFWFLETMMGLTDRVGWLRFYEAMVNYKLAGNLLKWPIAYLVAFAIFILGNTGIRILSLKELFNLSKKVWDLNYIDLFLITVIFAGFTVPLLFLQKGTPWNTIQFTYYSLTFLSIYAGVSVGKMMTDKNILFRSLLALILVLLTIPTVISTLKDYVPKRPPAMLPNTEIDALEFLSRQPEGIVLTYPFDKYKADEAKTNPPRPLRLYESTAYVSAYSHKPVFLEDEVNLDITGYDWRQRRKEVEAFYKNPQIKEVREFLSKNNIKYIYWIKGQRAYLGEEQLGIRRIFENAEVDIYERI